MTKKKNKAFDELAWEVETAFPNMLTGMIKVIRKKYGLQVGDQVSVTSVTISKDTQTKLNQLNRLMSFVEMRKLSHNDVLKIAISDALDKYSKKVR